MCFNILYELYELYFIYEKVYWNYPFKKNMQHHQIHPQWKVEPVYLKHSKSIAMRWSYRGFEMLIMTLLVVGQLQVIRQSWNAAISWCGTYRSGWDDDSALLSRQRTRMRRSSIIRSVKLSHSQTINTDNAIKTIKDNDITFTFPLDDRMCTLEKMVQPVHHRPQYLTFWNIEVYILY